MKKNLIKIALIGIAAGICLSAKAAPAKKSQEIAMAKCTKENGKKKCESSCSCKNGDAGCNGKTSAGRNNYMKEKFKPKKGEIAGKRKSAAQKVMEGY